MTDTIDVAALASVLTTTAKQLHRQADNASFVAEGFIRVIDPPYLIEMLSGAATALQSQADALAGARRELAAKEHMWLYECEKHSEWLEKFMVEKARATTAEASLATMREALEEIAHSAETHSHVIVIARAALAKEGK